MDVIETALAWSFVFAIQVIGAAILIRRPTTVSRPRAYDLLFAGHVPWSLWLLAMSGFVLLTDNADLEFAAAVGLIPAMWTARIMFVFCRVVLQITREQARRRLLVHQMFIWSFTVVYIFVAAALWPRFLGVIGQ